MKKEFRVLSETSVQITTADERWYSKMGTNKATGLPEVQFVPSVSWIAGHYPKGVPFYRWLADKGWDEAEAIKSAAGDKGSRVHHAIVDLIDGGTVPMEAKYAGSDGDVQELSLEEYGCLMAFRDFWATCEPETLAREQTVFSDEHNYAGTLDWVGMLHKPPKGFSNGPWVLDWKTSQYVWPEHELQVSAYAHSDWIRDFDTWPVRLEGQAKFLAFRAEHVGGPGWHLGVLQVGYRKNKAGWKLTEVEDKFELFLAARRIWEHESGSVAPLRKDYPLSLSLSPKVAP